jgi:crotonobetainyl-CoA:carnitine CoA-transferase CaiB-like acyl-CoA transferase
LSWTAGKCLLTDPGPDALTALARGAHLVLDEPHDDTSVHLEPSTAPETHWVRITPFGLTGPRARWRATDLGVMAASGNQFSTGDPDRAPLRPSEPASYAHVGGEAAYAAIAALASGRRQIVDVSMQECVLVANMGAAGRYARAPVRGQRAGAKIGRTREIYPTLDGFVSFGIRGGAARRASMELISTLVREAGIVAPALDQDWSTWSQNTATDDDLAAMERAIGTYFATKTSAELYDIACATKLMLAPVNSPREVLSSAQLDARSWFVELGEIERFPRSFVIAHGVPPAGATRPAVRLEATPPWTAPTPFRPTPPTSGEAGPWAGVRILEFGSGAAGPIATRYFAEHGATVLRVESPSRPDFLRAMAVAPDNPLGLEGAPMYDALNCGKRHVTLNLKHPDAVALVLRLVAEWADAVAENYAPRAMVGFGLGYEALREIKPDLVMISACLNGQTGPHKDYPGFGGQGSALSGWNWVTGWPDREPVGPFGTITDSLAPRYVAAALAAGIWHQRTTGAGCYLDVSQVEAGLYALSPWLLDYQLTGTVGMRNGNAASGAKVHGVFACADEGEIGDRWVAIVARADPEYAALREMLGCDPTEDAITAWTRTRTRIEIANAMQAVGIEAVPVADFADLTIDPQLTHREHFETHVNPFMGPGRYERTGVRFSAAPTGYDRAGPTLGQDNDWVFGELLGLDEAAVARLADSEAFV